jgi:hypothetical protein
MEDRAFSLSFLILLSFYFRSIIAHFILKKKIPPALAGRTKYPGAGIRFQLVFYELGNCRSKVRLTYYSHQVHPIGKTNYIEWNNVFARFNYSFFAVH